jgi:hypothetical protein
MSQAARSAAASRSSSNTIVQASPCVMERVAGLTGHQAPSHRLFHGVRNLSVSIPKRLAHPPKYAVPQVVGYIKGKSAIHLAGSMQSASATSWDSTFGAGVLREHGRPRRGGHPSLHPQSRERGSEARTIEPLALTMPP